jgi:hypothetical protein
VGGHFCCTDPDATLETGCGGKEHITVIRCFGSAVPTVFDPEITCCPLNIGSASGSSSSIYDPGSLSWYANVTPAGTGSYNLNYGGTITNPGCGGHSYSFDITHSGLACGVPHSFVDSSTLGSPFPCFPGVAGACTPGSTTEPENQKCCSSAYCGSPYGICNSFWLLIDFGVSASIGG